MDGNTARGASSSAKPALMRPEPQSMMTALLDSNDAWLLPSEPLSLSDMPNARVWNGAFLSEMPIE
jgi:hypothetical protein